MGDTLFLNKKGGSLISEKVVARGPRLEVRYLSISCLRSNPQNPRLHSDKQVKQIARSIKAFGPIVPVLIDGSSRVIAGHGRLQAAQLLGLTELPTICIEHLSEEQAKAFAIADNKLTENSTWNRDLLGEQLKALSEAELDFDVEAIGFEMAEIDLLIEGLSPATETHVDPADEVPASA